MIHIIARRGREAEDYAKALGLSRDQWHYVDRPERLRGLKDVEIHLIGYYHEHRDWAHMRREIESRNLAVKEVMDWR